MIALVSLVLCCKKLTKIQENVDDLRKKGYIIRVINGRVLTISQRMRVY